MYGTGWHSGDHFALGKIVGVSAMFSFLEPPTYGHKMTAVVDAPLNLNKQINKPPAYGFLN